MEFRIEFSHNNIRVTALIRQNSESGKWSYSSTIHNPPPHQVQYKSFNRGCFDTQDEADQHCRQAAKDFIDGK